MYPFSDKGKRKKFKFDYILFISVVLLSIFGVIVLSSATSIMAGGTRMVMTQVVSMVLGIGICLAINFLDYNIFKSLSAFMYVFGILLLIGVLLFGVEISGSRRWLMIPIIKMSIQPSELVKIFFILFISKHFEKLVKKIDRITILKIVVFVAIPIFLILRQTDGGMAITYLFILCVITFVHGIPYKYIFAGIPAMIATLPIIWMFLLKDYHKRRIISFLDPSSDLQGAAYQVNRAEMTVGSGRFWGQGLFNGTQSQSLEGVPVKESDFIFTVIAEELGFIGCIILISLILLILFRCIYISWKSKDMYGSYVAIGITAMLAFNFIQNIGMNIALFPVSGIPLPFVSAGGSAIVTYYIAIGIVMSISMHSEKGMFNTNDL